MSNMRSSVSHTAVALTVAFAAACGGAAGEAKPPEATPAAPEPPAPSSAAPVTEESPYAAGAAAAKTTDEPEAPLGEGDTRTMEAIAALVKSHRKEARTCYEEGRKQVENLKGDLVVHFVLKPSGDVKLAELNKERSTITEPSVVKCVIGVITAIKFPKSSKGLETTVNYPFNFNP
jgi:hypothetical protein